MPMPTWDDLDELHEQASELKFRCVTPEFSANAATAIATLRLAIAAERIADSLEAMQAAGVTGDAPAEPC
jgi:hypothetical protein